MLNNSTFNQNKTICYKISSLQLGPPKMVELLNSKVYLCDSIDLKLLENLFSGERTSISKFEIDWITGRYVYILKI